MADQASSTSDLSSKRAKIADAIVIDVISSLPDAVLCHILSFIPTQHAVATSVLSKRWKLLWTSIPNLNFTLAHCDQVNQSNFMNFVDRVLSLNDVMQVQKVYLDCTEDCEFSRIKEWTSAIAGRDTEEFTLHIPWLCRIANLDEISSMISLPDSFFIKKNLNQLWLDKVSLKVPTSVDFPSLKTIHFDSVQFLDDDSMKNLLAGCPVLEKLLLWRGEAWDNAQTLYICSASLSFLNLFTRHYDNSKNSGYKVVIEAPKLRRLILTDYEDIDYDMNNISSLMEARVHFEQGDIVDAFDERLYEFFRKMSHIHDLSLSTSTMRALEDTFFENLLIFNNLTSLKVEVVSPMLPYLLNSSPNLVTFIMEYVHSDHCEWYEPEHVPQCLLSSLEYIEMERFQQCDAEMELVYYFLNNAMVLKKMTIHSYNLDIESEIDILKELVDFPRRSSTCQVEYSNQKPKFNPFF